MPLFLSEEDAMHTLLKYLETKKWWEEFLFQYGQASVKIYSKDESK
jgi:hypothetical protein